MKMICAIHDEENVQKPAIAVNSKYGPVCQDCYNYLKKCAAAAAQYDSGVMDTAEPDEVIE